MRWIRPLSPEVAETAAVLGGKAHGLITLRQLGLPVPTGFVISTDACREFLRVGQLPDGIDDELAAAVADLAGATRRLGGSERELAVSVRSGASVSMPGMMATILSHDLAAQAAALAADTVAAPLALEPLKSAVTAVFSSWNTPRATTYRELNGIPSDLGTAVIVQAMVYGDRDDHSGSGVAFSRDPNTGEPVPFGDVLFGRRGEGIVSGGSLTAPLHDLARREPTVWSGLLAAMRRVEEHYRDACYLEFTFEAGELWLLQVRSGGFAGAAAVRVATELADEGAIDRREALLRVSPQQLHRVRTPRIATVDRTDLLARGLGACPGVAAGRIATEADTAVRMAADGPVVLVRPETSPLDLHGIAAAAGLLTARGGAGSHAAVVARSMGKPAVVGASDLVVDVADRAVRAGRRAIGEGTTITIDGTSGYVVLGDPGITNTADDPFLDELLAWADEVSGDSSERPEPERLAAAHAALRHG